MTTAIDAAIVLAIYAPAIAFLAWVLDGLIERLARRAQRREHDDRARPVRRTPAAPGLQVAEEPHLERLLIAGDITPAQLITGAPREAGRPHQNLAA